MVGLVISMILLGDFSLVLLALLKLYSISLVDVLLALSILPLGLLLPFPAGINALFSHGPRRSAGLARVYALWNIMSLVNVVRSFCSCSFVVDNLFRLQMQMWTSVTWGWILTVISVGVDSLEDVTCLNVIWQVFWFCDSLLLSSADMFIITANHQQARKSHFSRGI